MTLENFFGVAEEAKSVLVQKIQKGTMFLEEYATALKALQAIHDQCDTGTQLKHTLTY